MISPPVLLVIPSFNEDKHIEKVVGTLAGELCPRSLIVVADGGSTDSTRQLVGALMKDEPRLRLLHNPAKLQSAGVNAAVERFGADFEWLVRADAHASYPRNFVAPLLAEAERTGADSVVTAMRTQGYDRFSDAVAAAQNARLGTGGAAHRRADACGWVDHGHHSLFRLSTFRSVGGYDATMSHNEDAELDVRLAKAGGRVWLTSETHVVYHPRNTVVALARQYRNHGAGRARTLAKHRLPPKLRQLAPAATAPALLLALMSPLSILCLIPVAGWTALSLMGGAWLAWRSGKAHVGASGPAAMIMHFSWSIGFWSALLGCWLGVSRVAAASLRRNGRRLRSVAIHAPGLFASPQETRRDMRP